MSENEEDWFESAVENGDDAADEEGTVEGDDWFEEDPVDSWDSPGSVRSVDPEQSGESGADGPSPGRAQRRTADGSGDGGPDSTDADGFADIGDEFDTADTTAGSSDDAAGTDGELFEDNFAAALGDADVPDPSGGPGGGGGSGGGGEFGMGGGNDLGTDVDFGMGGGFGAPGDEGFEEDLDTELDRINLGIEGLDDMIQGGVPTRSLMVAIGSAGTGKTTLGIQFLDQEFQKDDPGRGVFITLEETKERIINSATEKGFPFDEYIDEGQLAIVDLDPVEMANSLATIRSELPSLIQEFDANRLVLDSVSLLEMMYDNRAERRNEIFDFSKSLKQAGVTTMLTSEANENNPYASRYGIVEYLTDAVFVLQYVRPSDFRKTRLAIEIQKIRDANHSRETKPYEITGEGISVYRQANIF